MNIEDITSENWPDYTANADKQTQITQEGDNRDEWQIATTDYVFMRRMMKKGWKPLPKSKIGGVVYFKVSPSHITFNRQSAVDSRRARSDNMKGVNPFA